MIRQMIRDSLVVPIVSPEPKWSNSRPFNPKTEPESDLQDSGDTRNP